MSDIAAGRLPGPAAETDASRPSASPTSNPGNASTISAVPSYKYLSSVSTSAHLNVAGHCRVNRHLVPYEASASIGKQSGVLPLALTVQRGCASKAPKPVTQTTKNGAFKQDSARVIQQDCTGNCVGLTERERAGILFAEGRKRYSYISETRACIRVLKRPFRHASIHHQNTPSEEGTPICQVETGVSQTWGQTLSEAGFSGFVDEQDTRRFEDFLADGL